MTGKYTVDGSFNFDKRVDHDLSEIVRRVKRLPNAKKITEIVLLGGYGRGEGTPYKSRANSEAVPYNDYDLVVVSQPLWPWHHRGLQNALNQLGEELAREFGIAVDLYLHTRETLQSCEPSLLNIEMKWGHRTVWGTGDALAQMPPFALSSPPLSEGVRLLMNRGRLLLQVGSMLSGGCPLPLTEDALCRKYLYKNALAFGDCILIAHGDYDLLYQNKIKQIEHYRHDETIPCVGSVIAAYQSACRFKLYGHAEDLPQGDLKAIYRELEDIYPRFLLWYESRRFGHPVASIEDYCRQLTTKRDPPLLKTVALNTLLFGWRMFKPNISWSFIHPRRRLPPALCLMLNTANSNKILATQLLGCETDPNQMLARFQTLSARLA